MSAVVDDSKRVVVTGLGVISGCGIGADDFFQACLDGKSSIAKVQRFDIQHYPCQIASEVPADMFVAADHFSNPKNARSNDRFTHFAVAAARQALKDAKLGDTPETLENADRVGVMVGSAFGGMETFEKETLKLAKKPERPKVSYAEASAVLGRLISRLSTHNTDLTWPCRMVYPTLSLSARIGFALYNPGPVGQYRFRCDWH
jgi:3-oxoacyl-[acyl-carrier-protein] synthase II